ncbi:hypothetical protein AWB79_07503 [Caballeronia hypogeia]|uniref:Uncharacterized protein n=1 Tax=Caballeronia hypogeia TaxID=1777140 RepID=A0A158DSY2_9BURK|nr:hypothetical protein [Caballeronia hypogeia]SAK97694.1 hypothetical protein AWB79_07503 [Caballeronia hypogeia]
MSESNSQAAATFLAPPSIEVFRQDLVEMYLFQLGNLAWMVGEPAANRLLQREPSVGLLNLGGNAAEVGLTYEDIRGANLAKAMELLYHFAYFGRLDESAEFMGEESIYNWLAAILFDVRQSQTATYRDNQYQCKTLESAERCVVVAELANARNILEGGESFFHFSRANTKDEPAFDDYLTVRQLALLAGMEEMSIRAAANKNRANALKTIPEEGRTRFEIGVAKEWLRSKGRYVPITRYQSEGDVDLARRRFANPADLWEVLNARLEFLSRSEDGNELAARIGDLGLSLLPAGVGGQSFVVSEAQMHDSNTMKALANVLRLPGHLLVLRMREAFARAELAAVEQSLRDIQTG